ncbi:Uncharacterised protein [uncultured archaeon]|nr:Uncharacterised protein [uncultured archaeon]
MTLAMDKAFAVLAALILVSVIIAGCGSQPQAPQNVPPQAGAQTGGEKASPQPSLGSGGAGSDKPADPTAYAVRQRYFEEAFKPYRNDYNLFGKAAAFLKMPIEKMPEYFSLNSESEIFADLPPVPKDFSEVAYLLVSGKNYAIGKISSDYYLQPEFYPGFKESGLRFWSEPNPKYWGVNGYGTYPAEQFDTLSLSGRSDFTAVVFFYASYGVQTYQGVTLVPSAETMKNFDVNISPDTFLLTPTFPKFNKDWAQAIVIKGELKPDTPPGDYTLGFLISSPPKEKKEEWSFKYRNLYFDAAGSIGPSGYPIKFNVTVEK